MDYKNSIRNVFFYLLQMCGNGQRGESLKSRKRGPTFRSDCCCSKSTCFFIWKS